MTQKNYPGTIKMVERKSQQANLLKTIKYDPRDIKGLGAKLPKAKYQQEAITEESAEEDKLQKFMDKRRIMEERELMKKREMQNLESDRHELEKKRERVLSACGVRKNSIGTLWVM